MFHFLHLFIIAITKLMKYDARSSINITATWNLNSSVYYWSRQQSSTWSFATRGLRRHIPNAISNVAFNAIRAINRRFPRLRARQVAALMLAEREVRFNFKGNLSVEMNLAIGLSRVMSIFALERDIIHRTAFRYLMRTIVVGNFCQSINSCG